MREIPLTQGQTAIVDDADYDWLCQWKWFAAWAPSAQAYYAVRKVSNRNLGMHTALTGWALTDHIDNNPLNNCRSNLREASRADNSRNATSRIGTSRYKGVYWHKTRQRWAAQIRTNGKQTHIGYFRDETDAARAYNERAQEVFGEFAYINPLPAEL